MRATDLKLRMDELELKVRDICVGYDNLVPSKLARQKIIGIKHEIEDISKGRNGIEFNRKGQPSCVDYIFPDKENSLPYLSGGGSYFDVPAATANTESTVHGAFMVNGAIKGLAIGKYPAGRYKGKNIFASIYGLPPAYGPGGFTASYSGTATEVDACNAATNYTEGKATHNLTYLEYALLHMKAVRAGFQCHGNCSYGQYTADERGISCGPYNNNRPVHTLSGSGPLVWRHDGTPFGIEICGNAFRVLHGARFVGGVLQVIPYNNVAEMTASQHPSAAAVDIAVAGWKELAEDGTYVDPGNGNTWRVDYKSTPPETGSAGAGIWCLEQENIQTNTAAYMSSNLVNWGVKDGLKAPFRLIEAGVYPFKAGNLPGPFEARNYKDMVRVFMAGGVWNSGTGILGFGYRSCYGWDFSSAGDYGTVHPCFLIDIQ